MRLMFEVAYKIVLGAVLVFSIFNFYVDFANLKLITADGSIYLNIADNIVHHAGFVVSYNLCQCFNTLYHPIWAYYQPLYPVFVSLFIDHGGITQVIKANILLFALNVILILYLIQEVMPTFFNILFFLFLVFSFNCYISALYPWTEQLHLLGFLVTFILFLKFSKNIPALAGVGFLNGVCMLIRVAHLYNFLAYLPVFFIGKDPLAQKLRRVFTFVGGFILAYGLYQLFCLTVYHTFYPEYARPGASYGMARFDSGIVYDLHKIGLQVPLGPLFSWQHLRYVGQHLRDFYGQMPLFLWPALFYFFLPPKKKAEGGFIELCLLQSLFTILGYSLTFYWLTYSFDSLRYSMIPYILVSMAGWYCIYEGLELSESKGKQILGVLLFIGVFLLPQIQRTLHFRDRALKHVFYRQRPYYRYLFDGYQWIDRNLPQRVLVASDEDQEAYFMHRPFISMPIGQSYNCTNLALYNHIYAPDYYLLSVLVPEKCFTTIVHTTVYANRGFRVLKITKPNK